MLGSVKMGEASLGCSLPACSSESIIPDVLLCLSSNRSCPSCSSSWMLFAVFLALIKSASSHSPPHPLTLTSTDPQTPASAPWQPILRSLGPESKWFLFQVQRHFIRGQAAYSKRSGFLSHDAPFLRGWVSAIFFIFLNFNNSNCSFSSSSLEVEVFLHSLSPLCLSFLFTLLVTWL